MAEGSTVRALDAGGAFVLEEHDPPAPCAHGVCVETQFDGADDEVTLLLRHAHRHGNAPIDAYGERTTIAFSLLTGDCSPRDPAAEHFLAERPWLRPALLRRLNWLGDRAHRAIAQRDRRTSCFAALDRANPGAMIYYDRLFPADWDLLFHHEGRSLWAVDLHCSNPACDCTEVVVELNDVERVRAEHIGEMRIDLASARLRHKTSSRRVSKLFKPLWSRYGDELLRRHREVRLAVSEHAALHTVAQAVAQPIAQPIVVRSRNAPCPCGSGMKYKHCCAPRAGTSEPATSPAPFRAVR
jgi:hypothetical protein